MGRYVTLSIKVPEELKQKARRLGVRTGEVMRTALEKAVLDAEFRELENRAEELKGILEKLPPDWVVKAIREDRESR